MGLGKHEEISSGEVARGDGGEIRSRKSERCQPRECNHLQKFMEIWAKK